MIYAFNEDELEKFVRYVRRWHMSELHNDRLADIHSLELADLTIAAIRQWDGSGVYIIEGPCEIQGQQEIFYSFTQFADFMGNFSRTMKMTKVMTLETAGIKNVPESVKEMYADWE